MALQSERAEYESAAERADLELSEWIRQTLNAEAARTKSESTAPKRSRSKP